MRTVLRSGAGMLAIAVLGGCRQQSSFARIEGVLVEAQAEARPVESGETGKLEVTRGGRESQGRPDMSLEKGDALATGPDGVGVMALAGGYRIIMDPGTDLTLENPSIFVRLGRVIVKKIGEVREALTVKTTLGTAAVEGTEFVLEVDRGQVVQVTVLEGQVKIYPAEGLAWRDTLTYVPGKRGRLDSARFEWLTPLSASAADSIRRRIKHLESTAGAPAIEADSSQPDNSEADSGGRAERGRAPPPNTGDGKDSGTVSVTGTGKELYHVEDSTGENRVIWNRATNSVAELLPGTYIVTLNGSHQRVSVAPDRQTVVRAGSVMVAGTGKELYHVEDSTGENRLVWNRPTNAVVELLPGTYTLTAGDRHFRVRVRPGEQTKVGSLSRPIGTPREPTGAGQPR
jgi:hypothetical protein